MALTIQPCRVSCRWCCWWPGRFALYVQTQKEWVGQPPHFAFFVSVDSEFKIALGMDRRRSRPRKMGESTDAVFAHFLARQEKREIARTSRRRKNPDLRAPLRHGLTTSCSNSLSLKSELNSRQHRHRRASLTGAPPFRPSRRRSSQPRSTAPSRLTASSAVHARPSASAHPLRALTPLPSARLRPVP